MNGRVRFPRLHSLFAQFLATYVLLLLIPLVLAVAVNGAVLIRFQSTVEDSQLALLRQARDVVSQSVNDLEWRIFQIAGNPRLSRLITEYRARGVEDFTLIRELVTYLQGYTLYSSNLKSTFYLYLREPQIVLTPYAMYRHEDFTDARTYLRIEGTTLADWHRDLLDRYYRRGFFPARRVTIEDFTDKPMIPYVQSLPIAANLTPDAITGVIVFFIGEEEFGSLLSNVVLPEGGWTYIANEGGQVLTGMTSGNDTLLRPVPIESDREEGLHRTTIDGQDVFVVHTRSADGWTYVAVLPSQPILAPVYRLQRVSILSLALSMLISMAVASVVSFRRAKPLQGMLESVREIAGLDPDEAASIRALNSGVRSLIDQSRHLQAQLQRQEAFHQNLLVSRLLEGSFRNRNEMQSFMSYLDIAIDESCFVAVAFSLVGFETLDTVEMIDQLNETKVILKDLVRRHVHERYFVHDGNDESMGLIVMSGRSEPEDLTDRLVPGLHAVHDEFETVHHDRLLVGVGCARPDILGIAASFEEARIAVSHSRRTPATHVAIFSEDLADTGGYYFPIDLEVRLSNAARAGDSDSLEDAFGLIHRENFVKRAIVGSQLRLLYYELVGAYQKLASTLAGSEVVDDEDAGEPAFDDPRAIDEIRARFVSLASRMNLKKRSHNRELIDSIQRFITDHYQDHGLGLYAVASTFSITESYLSFFFKEQTGENFSTYVENVRIERAVELLRNTDAGIAEVAATVGYNSDKTFRRVFKKVKGIRPSDYRRDRAMRGAG